MSERVYVLVELENKDINHTARVLRCKLGVMCVDILESTPNLIFLLQANTRHTLAKSLVDILDSLDGIAEDLRILPVQTSTSRHQHSKSSPELVF